MGYISNNCQAEFQKALICIDSFHVMMLINDALNTIRLRIMSQFEKKDSEYYLLKKFAWLLIKNESDLRYDRKLNRRLNRYMSYRDILNDMKTIDDTLFKAWQLKEAYQHLNQTSNVQTIESNLNNFLDQTAKANIGEFNDIAATIKNWKKEIINSFQRIGTRRISNGPIESINGQIKKIKKCGNGYTNFARFRNKAIYSINKNENFDLSGTDIIIKKKGKPRGKYKKQECKG